MKTINIQIRTMPLFVAVQPSYPEEGKNSP